MERNGVISRVENLTEWSAPMVVIPKNDGKVRICVDLIQSSTSSFNAKIILCPPPTQHIATSREHDIFRLLDSNSGFWQIKFSERSKPLTTFITPWRRYCFNVLPFGINSNQIRNQSQILEGLDGVECNIDDVLVHGATEEEHDQRLEAVLQRLADANVTLNAEK